MQRDQATRRIGLAALELTVIVAVAGMAGSASGNPPQYYSQIPIVGGSRHGLSPGLGNHRCTGSFARGHGNISLTANAVSAILCEVDRVRNQPDRLIAMTVEHHLAYHSHFAVTWGCPGPP